MQNTMRQIAIYALSMFLALLLFFGIVIVYAWTEPASAPPAGNVSAPVNVGGTSQYKSGALGVGGVFHGYSTGLFDGNVGIGTTNPGDVSTIIKLDVVGGIKFGGTTGNHLIANAANFVLNKGNSTGSFYFRKNTVTGDPDVYTDLLVIDNDGNMGMGITGPGAKLDIQTSYGANAFKINTFKMVPISSTELGVYDSGNNQVLIFDQGI